MNRKFILMTIITIILLSGCYSYHYSDDSEVAKYFLPNDNYSRIDIIRKNPQITYSINSIDDLYIDPESKYSSFRSFFLPVGKHRINISYRISTEENQGKTTSSISKFAIKEFNLFVNKDSYQIVLWTEDNKLESGIE